MLDMLDLILWPLLAAFVLTGIHVYLGLHVVTRGVIFVDLALAQVAALGTAVGVLLGLGHESPLSYIVALSFTFLGAALFAVSRVKDERIPQEATIGITYVVTAAVMILLLAKSPEGAEHVNHLLVGSILFVMPKTVGMTFGLYAVIGLFHWIFREQFLKASEHHARGREPDARTRFWDFLFYITFGFVVTSSVKIAGVLLVFSFLIIPAVAALLFVEGHRNRLIFGWIFGIVVSVAGMLLSLGLDIPTGASIVATFGGLLAVLAIVRVIMGRLRGRQPDTAP
jgi:zinc/manganese transport system permease protein